MLLTEVGSYAEARKWDPSKYTQGIGWRNPCHNQMSNSPAEKQVVMAFPPGWHLLWQVDAGRYTWFERECFLFRMRLLRQYLIFKNSTKTLLEYTSLDYNGYKYGGDRIEGGALASCWVRQALIGSPGFPWPCCHLRSI